MDPQLLQLIRNLISQELALKNPIQPQSQPIQQVTIQDTKKIIEIENKLKEIENKIPEIDVSPKSQPLNYTTRGEQDGKEVRFTLFGQVLTPEEEALYGDINYIEFGGSGSSHPFKLYTVTVGDPPQQKIAITSGFVNEQAPSGINDIFSPANGDSLYINVNFTQGGSFINSEIATGQTVPQNTPTNLYILIGKVSLENDIYTISRQALFNDVIVRRFDVCVDGFPKVDFIITANTEAIPI